MSTKKRRLKRMQRIHQSFTIVPRDRTCPKTRAVKPVKNDAVEDTPMWRSVSKIVLVVVAAGLLLYDLLPFFDPATHDTLSEVIAEYALKLFFIPWSFGVLCGHFFWMQDGSRPRPWILIPLILAVIALDVVAHTQNVEVLLRLQRYPAMWCVAGIPCGAIFWPQTKSDKE